MDVEILIQLKSGNQEGIYALYNKHYIGLVNYGLKLTGDRELTNDCIAQVLLRLWEKRESLPLIGNYSSYLHTCLRRELFHALKSESKRFDHYQCLKNMSALEEQSYEDYIINSQTNESLKADLSKALSKLTHREKQLLELKYFENLDYDEIALKCRITKRTAYNIIHAALKSLKIDLQESSQHQLVQ